MLPTLLEDRKKTSAAGGLSTKPIGHFESRGLRCNITAWLKFERGSIRPTKVHRVPGLIGAIYMAVSYHHHRMKSLPEGASKALGGSLTGSRASPSPWIERL